MKIKTLLSFLVIASLVVPLPLLAEEDTIYPQVTSVYATDMTATSARIVIEVSEPVTATFRYAPSSGELSVNPTTAPDLVIAGTQGSLMLTGLSSGATYYYQVEIKDAANNVSTSLLQSFNTADGAQPDTTPPSVLSAVPGSITANSAVITVTVSEPAEAVIAYSTVEAVLENSPMFSATTTGTVISLSGLTASTTYYYVVMVRDASGNSSMSATQSFATSAGVDEPVDNGNATTTATTTFQVLAAVPGNITDTSTEVVLTLSCPASSTTLWYAKAEPVASNNPVQVGPNASTTLALTGLTPGTTYYFYAMINDGAGQTSYSSTHSFTTTGTAPEVSNNSSDNSGSSSGGSSSGSRRSSRNTSPPARVAGAFTSGGISIGFPQTGGINAFSFGRNLGLGMSGDDVTTLQQRLMAEGVYSGPVTGYYGPLTTAAVRRYQAFRGIIETGFTGPLTRGELNRAIAMSSSPISASERAAALNQIQTRLSAIVSALSNYVAERAQAAEDDK